MSLCAQCIVKDISYTEFGLVSFYGGIQRSKTFFHGCQVGLIRIMQNKSMFSRKAWFINVTNKFIRK
ncbi:hypothetical protein APT89_14740 [Enterobacter sp. 50588862]|nr:hypothetical protein ABR26_03695 [Enterobacter bugandensis]KSX61408.1 hypothetical protein APT89_14740 [Enterobacter sp. 50588862]